MASERPEPAHTSDGAAPTPPASEAAARDAQEAILLDGQAGLDAALAARRSLAEGLRDVLSLPALGPTTKRGKVAQLLNPDHLLDLLRRWHRRTPTMADVISVCVVSKVLERGPQAVTAFREIADRLDGPVTQRLALSITPEQAERMSDEELAHALKRAGLLGEGSVH